AGWRAGWTGSPWYREPRPKLRWKTIVRMTLAGRLPII
ncbi:glycosyl transferase, partial [Arthrobacter sp. MYb222]